MIPLERSLSLGTLRLFLLEHYRWCMPQSVKEQWAVVDEIDSLLKDGPRNRHYTKETNNEKTS